MPKELFEEPELELVQFNEADILEASDTGDDNDCPWDMGP